MPRNKNIFFITLLSFCVFSNVFSVSVFKRAINLVQGPGAYVLQNSKEITKGIKEPYYWLAVSYNKTLDSAAIHEAGHTLVAYKLGFRVKSVSVFEDWVFYNDVSVGKTEIEIEGFENEEKIDPKKLDDETLENFICVFLAGGLITDIVYGNSYGMTSDDAMINITAVELLKRRNPGKIDKFLCSTKDFLFFSKMDFDIRLKELKRECYEKTEKILKENMSILNSLAEELKNFNKSYDRRISRSKILSEDRIKEIIDGVRAYSSTSLRTSAYYKKK